MSEELIKQLVESYAQIYPPLITAQEAAEIARCPLGTIYDYSSRGLLDSIKSRRGRRVLFELSGFVRFIAPRTDQH